MPPRPGRRKTPFDRHWPYPDPAATARRLLGDSKAGRDLTRRIAAGDPHRVLAWMRGHEGPFELFNVLQLGLGGAAPAENSLLLFDEVPVATQTYAGPAGTTDTLYARRTGRGVAYRVRSDEPGKWAHWFTADAPLTRAEVRRLFADPPWRKGPVDVATGLTFHVPGPAAWDPTARPDRLGGWDEPVSLDSCGAAPCPACGADYLRDRCVHCIFASSNRCDCFGFGEFGEWGYMDWAGRSGTLERLGGAYYELKEAVDWMAGSRQPRFLKAALPDHLWRLIEGEARSYAPPPGRRRTWAWDDAGRDCAGVESYLIHGVWESPTRLGSYQLCSHDGCPETLSVDFDTMAGTRARALDQQLTADTLAFRRAAVNARALEPDPDRRPAPAGNPDAGNRVLTPTHRYSRRPPAGGWACHDPHRRRPRSGGDAIAEGPGTPPEPEVRPATTSDPPAGTLDPVVGALTASGYVFVEEAVINGPRWAKIQTWINGLGGLIYLVFDAQGDWDLLRSVFPDDSSVDEAEGVSAAS